MMYRFATIQNVTDGQTDRRQTTQRAKGALTVGQKWTPVTLLPDLLALFENITEIQYFETM